MTMKPTSWLSAAAVLLAFLGLGYSGAANPIVAAFLAAPMGVLIWIFLDAMFDALSQPAGEVSPAPPMRWPRARILAGSLLLVAVWWAGHDLAVRGSMRVAERAAARWNHDRSTGRTEDAALAAAARTVAEAPRPIRIVRRGQTLLMKVETRTGLACHWNLRSNEGRWWASSD